MGPALTFLLLITTGICLTAIKAEEQPAAPEAGNRQAKQIFLTPQYHTANIPFYYPDGSRYGNPLGYPHAMSPVEPFFGASQGAGFAYDYPSLAFNDDSIADWRHVASGGHDVHRVNGWKRNSHREATINIFPNAEECWYISADTDGLGPCKVATQAEQGTITMKFTNEFQMAVIGIVADSQKHNRIRLTCTEIADAVQVFTQSGEIKEITDTPRTEIGYMQLVMVMPESDKKNRQAVAEPFVRCNWMTYYHRTAMYP